MGALLSRWRKSKEPTEILEELEGNIQECINFRLANQESQKRWAKRLLLWGVAIYLTLVALFYFVYFPDGGLERITHSCLVVAVPLFFLFLFRKTLIWYYSRRITYNEEKLLELKEEKEKTLQEVMETMPYNKASKLLERFGSDKHKAMTPPRLGTPVSAAHTPGTELRQRRGAPAKGMPPITAPPPPSSAALAIGAPQTPLNKSPGAPTVRPSLNTPVRPVGPPGSVRPNGPAINGTPVRPRTFMAPPNTPGGPMIRPPALPRPIVAPDRGPFEKMVDYLVGDGPSNRYALICRRCARHNGMALKEEFEYIQFHCAYCQFLNPAKRRRPIAPRLPIDSSNPPSECESEVDSNSTSPNKPLRPGHPPSRTPSAESLGPSTTAAASDGEGSVESAEDGTVSASAPPLEPTVEEEDSSPSSSETTNDNQEEVSPLIDGASGDGTAGDSVSGEATSGLIATGSGDAHNKPSAAINTPTYDHPVSDPVQGGSGDKPMIEADLEGEDAEEDKEPVEEPKSIGPGQTVKTDELIQPKLPMAPPEAMEVEA